MEHDVALDILLVEDNPADVRLTLEALSEPVRGRLRVARDGVEAMTFLHQKDPYVDVARPDLILLDLSLPRKDGREVLAEIKCDPELRRIPIVVLTTSDAPQDVLRSYELQANCYVTKPASLDQFMQVIQSVELFWSTVVRLPTE